ncbi:MAG: hypothetical protein NZ988_01080 [Thaumarchaeota archaeon]|nr:hypothetical protein [Candidatus Calditenuaceae archaeon]MDW8186626.1 hypothetical protein [Nitrososphaerota archaeon]
MRGTVAELPGGPYLPILFLAASLILLLLIRPKSPKPRARALPVHRVSRALRYALGEEESIDAKDVEWLVAEPSAGSGEGRERSVGVMRLYVTVVSLFPMGKRWFLRWAMRRV